MVNKAKEVFKTRIKTSLLPFHFLKVHKSGPFRIRIDAFSIIHAAFEASVTEIQPQTVKKKEKKEKRKDTAVSEAA